MLKKKETINNLVSRVVEVKLAAALKAQVTLENKNVRSKNSIKCLSNHSVE